MKSSTLKSQAGFSLVELMVVVAIIGVLAAMSVGQVQKQIAKARQSEAKSNLGALYTSATTFRSEYNTFTTDFTAMKLEITGRVRYRLGFTADHWPAVATGGAGNDATDFGYVGPANVNMFATTQASGTCSLGRCTETGEAIALAATACNQTSFTAEAASDIYVAGTPDIFRMNQDKNLTHPSDGIP